MELTNDQWAIIAPHIPISPRKQNRGRLRRDDRAILNGILWVLRTGAPWKDLPSRYPSYQTCHRRFQEWVGSGTLAALLAALAQDMEQRGKITLSECFIDGTFASAKKGGHAWAQRNAERAAKSWLLQTKQVFQSPSVWPLLLRMKSPWWRRRLPKDLRQKLRSASSATGPMTVIRSMPSSARHSASNSLLRTR